MARFKGKKQMSGGSTGHLNIKKKPFKSKKPQKSTLAPHLKKHAKFEEKPDFEETIKEEAEQTENSDVDDDDDEKKELKLDVKLEDGEKKKKLSNDVNEGCTVFIKNVPFDASDADLRKVCRKYGPVWYAIINREPISGHSKGTAFVKFKTKESADLCLQAGDEFTLDSEVLQSYPALSRDDIKSQHAGKSGDESKDSRNLYLAREGLIMAGSKAAEDVSASDMAKRHKLEQIKTQVLKNLNRFISRNRLSIHNLPLNYDNDNLKNMVVTYTGFRPHECRVMRENKITPEHPKGKSKGFGFMSFSTHKEALIALRKLNNNPKIFGTTHRPIVAFSIEDRDVHKIKQKREYKSRINNPTFIKKHEQQTAKKRKNKKEAPSTDLNESKDNIKKIPIKSVKKAHIENKKEPDQHLSKFTGTMAKPGTILNMRSNKKIVEQSMTHKQRVKANKRKEKQQKIKQIHLAERKQADKTKPKQKIEHDDLANLVSKYKNMIDGSSRGPEPTSTKKPKRTKWYKE